MNRYTQTSNSVGTRYDGKRFFRTTTYPTIPLDSSDTYIIVTSADFLDSLANKFYQDPTLWWVIAQANGLKGTLKPKVGSQLRIPGNISLILSNFSTANQ
jgi:nucleoid-associated protein YgaU